MGGKFYVSIHVSFANACVSKGYASGEWFGFGVHVPPFFMPFFRAASRAVDIWSGRRYVKPVARLERRISSDFTTPGGKL